jgi:hypothetical protein
MHFSSTWQDSGNLVSIGKESIAVQNSKFFRMEFILFRK